MCEECDRRAAATGTMTAAIAPGVSTVTLACVMDNYRPCQDSPYAKLPEPLLKTLADTYVALEAGTKDSEDRMLSDAGENPLQWVWRHGFANTWDALDHSPADIINLYRIIYDRVIAMMPSAWDLILWMRSAWIGSSMGVFVTYKDPVAARKALHDATRSGATPRIGFESRLLSERFHKNNDCWRELPADPNHAGDFAGLHVLVGDRISNPESKTTKVLKELSGLPVSTAEDARQNDQIHIDSIDPYKRRHSDGTCELPFHWGAAPIPFTSLKVPQLALDRDVIPHLLQVTTNIDILSPFVTLMNMGDVMTLAIAKGSETETADMREIRETWNKEHLSQAVLGQSGWDYFEPMAEYVRKLREDLGGKKR